MANLKIAEYNGRFVVTIDGKEVEDVVAVGLNVAVDEPSEVTLVLAPTTVEVDVNVEKITKAQLQDPDRYDSRGY